MRRSRISLTVITIMFAMLMFLAACSSGQQSGQTTKPDPSLTPGPAAEQESDQGSDQQLPETRQEYTIQRNEENDLVIAVTFQELLQAWNEAGTALGFPDAILPEKEDFQTYVTSAGIHSNHRTRHYVYAPGDEHFYPILHFYVSAETGELQEIDLSYNEHDYRDSTRKTYEEMCLVALTTLLPDLDPEELTALQDTVYEKGVEYIFPHEMDYGESAVPAILYHHKGIGVYPYFASGSRSHFCLIPVDQAFLDDLQSGGTEVKSIPQQGDA